MKKQIKEKDKIEHIEQYFDNYLDDEYDEHYENWDDETEFKDSGMLGSMLEAQLLRYGKGKCRQCGKVMEEKFPQDRFCSEKCKKEWEQLCQLRIEIGKRDLETRGFD